MSRPEPVGLGLACTGWSADWAVHDAVGLGAPVVVRAVASRSAARARRYADERDVAWAGTWEGLLARDDVEAVYVAVPNAVHGEFARRAIEAGKHVLVEKPLTRDRDEAAELAGLARRAGVVLAEGMHHRHDPRLRRTVAAVHAGAIGELLTVDIHYGWSLRDPTDIRWSAALHGGALMDVGCYGLDLARWLSGTDLEVRAVAVERFASGVDAASTVHLTPAGASGPSFRIRSTLCAPHFSCWATLRGTRGVRTLARPFLPVVPGNARQPTSYSRQLADFCRRIRGAVTGADEADTDAELVGRAGVLAAAARGVRAASSTT